MCGRGRPVHPALAYSHHTIAARPRPRHALTPSAAPLPPQIQAQRLPALSLAALLGLGLSASPALAADFAPAPATTPIESAAASRTALAATPAAPALFGGDAAAAPAAAAGLPEGTQWRYSEFIDAVTTGKVERVRFSKDGAQLQLTATDGKRAMVVLPNDPELVDILAKNGVDISVSEGEQQGNFVALLGNLLFPLIAFAGLFLLFRRAGDGSVSNAAALPPAAAFRSFPAALSACLL